jgi:hypothetical protein
MKQKRSSGRSPRGARSAKKGRPASEQRRAGAHDYQWLPPLTPEQRAALKVDIGKRGVMVPVEVDEDGHILDGHHRAAIAAKLGIDYPTIIRRGLNEDEKIAHILALNLHRRHLDPQQRRKLVADLRRRGWSLRRIAKAAAISKTTAHRDAPGVPGGTPGAVTGADGKRYRAERALGRDETPTATEGQSVPPPVDVESPIAELRDKFTAALREIAAPISALRAHVGKLRGLIVSLDAVDPAALRERLSSQELVALRALHEKIEAVLSLAAARLGARRDEAGRA